MWMGVGLVRRTGERRGDASGSRKSGTPFDGRNWQSVPMGNAGRWPANLILDAEAGAGAEWSRFFYCPKASKADRDDGLEGFEAKASGSLNMRTDAHSQANGMATAPRANTHPTVKPTDLMRWLARLVTPQGGTILDPFTGSGSTGKAARLEGFGFVGIEREPEYADIARARIEAVEPMLIGGVG
jgi:hypothetical protein